MVRTFPVPILLFHFCTVDSWNVFHSPHFGHFPTHFGDVSEHDEQINIGDSRLVGWLNLATATVYSYQNGATIIYFSEN